MNTNKEEIQNDVVAADLEGLEVIEASEVQVGSQFHMFRFGAIG